MVKTTALVDVYKCYFCTCLKKKMTYEIHTWLQGRWLRENETAPVVPHLVPRYELPTKVSCPSFTAQYSIKTYFRIKKLVNIPSTAGLRLWTFIKSCLQISKTTQRRSKLMLLILKNKTLSLTCSLCKKKRKMSEVHRILKFILPSP